MAAENSNVVPFSKPYISSVPDSEFERPETVDDLRQLAYTCLTVLCNVSGHLDDTDAQAIVDSVIGDLLRAHAWICLAKWAGQ